MAFEDHLDPRPAGTHNYETGHDAISDTGLALPERSWLWRRVLQFSTAIVCAFFLAWIISALAHAGDTSALMWVALAILAHWAFSQMAYLIAPSAEWMGAFAEAARAAKP